MWTKAYLEQARSDWGMYEFIIAQRRLPDCHALHYLQMATEKVGKAGQLKGGANFERIRTSHKGFTHFLRHMSKNIRLQRELQVNPRQLNSIISYQVIPLADEVERLAPALALELPNPEYPWPHADGSVISPVLHSFSIMGRLQQSNGRKFLQIAKIVIEKFEIFFS